jgi:diphthamide synthase (EF-2-diphthine--ammonia ligase)
LTKLIELSNKFRFNVDGEGGEYETLIIYGPHFSGSIKIDGEKQWLGSRGQYKINKISNSFDGFSS